MARNVLIIVTGPPGSGKSTLAASLSELLGVPLFTKDALKEALFDSMGVQDREWSRKLGAASMELLHGLIAEHLRIGTPLIVEANFRGAEAAERISLLCRTNAAHPIQIVCTAEENVLAKRVQERWESGRRHRGHNDAAFAAELKPGWSADNYGALEIGGSVYRMDTTDFSKVDYGKLFNDIKLRLAALRASEPTTV